ncbi:hypothetical protein IAU59_002080 [Kwoniella sp. CBS 9459]
MSSPTKVDLQIDKDLQRKQSSTILPDAVSDRIILAMRKWRIPDFRLAVVKNTPSECGKDHEPVAFSIALGDNVEYDIKFPLGSNSKLIALFALDKVLKANGHDIETPVKDILPDFQLADGEATELCCCKDIASHMTGLPAYNQLVEPGLTSQELTERLRCLPPAAAFRSQYQYCNIASAILMQIIELLSGRSFRDYVKEEIFAPLGMAHTSFEPDEKLSMGHFEVIGADGKEKEQMDLEYTFDKCPGIAAAGGVLTAGRDLLKWLRAIPTFPLYKTASSPAVSDGVSYPMHPPTEASYGLSMTQASYYYLNTIEHTGDTNTHSSLIVICPELKVKFGVMFNAGDHENGTAFTSWVRATLLDQFAGSQPKDWLPEMREVGAKGQQSLAAHFSSIQGDASLPSLIGTFKCAGFDTWQFDESNNVSVRPELTTLPGFEKLYGSVKVLVTAVHGDQLKETGEGWYAGCLQLTFDGGVQNGRVMHGAPFKAQLCEGGNDLLVFWLDGGQSVSPPLVFTKTGAEDC